MAEPATQCRGNVVAGEGGGGGGGMRTVECLRGRLLAERVASKAAKEEADQLAARLDELEKKLSDEVKIRNKAERRLRRAIKRLESLKILDVKLSGSSAGSLSSNGGCSSSSHHVPETEERNENDPGSLSTVDSGLRGGEEKGWDGSSAGSCTHVNSSQDGSWFSVVSEQSGSGLCKGESRVDPDDAKNGDSAGGVDDGSEREEQEERPAASSGGSSKSEDGSYRDEADDRLALVLVGDPHHEGGSATEGNTDRSKEGEEEENNNKLAIVLADPQPRRDAEPGSGGSDVQSVLLALQRVKEQLRCTIERKSEGLLAHRELYGH